MPDIVIPNVFTNGTVADAEQVSENTYLPKDPSTVDNPSVINGDLTNPNRDGWTISSQDVRRDHFSKSTMVSATANQDFFNDLYIGQSASGFPSGEWWEDAQVIPGCAVTFYTPTLMTALSLTWNISLVIDSNVQVRNSNDKTIKEYNAVGDPYSLSGVAAPYYDIGQARLILFINDLPVFPMQRIMLTGAASMAYDPNDPDFYYNNYYGPDTRDWCASFVWDMNMLSQNPNFDITKAPIYRGWHTADIRLVFPAYDEKASPPTLDGTDGVRHVRVKTRRMGYTLIR